MIAMCFLLGFRALSAEKRRSQHDLQPRADTHQSLIAERDAIFREIAKSDAAKIYELRRIAFETLMGP